MKKSSFIFGILAVILGVSITTVLSNHWENNFLVWLAGNLSAYGNIFYGYALAIVGSYLIIDSFMSRPPKRKKQAKPIQLPVEETITSPPTEPILAPKLELPILWKNDSRKSKLLIVEDSTNAIDYYLNTIKKMGLWVDIAVVDSSNEAIELLRNNEVAYAILDGPLREGDGLQVINFIITAKQKVTSIAASGSLLGTLEMLRVGCTTSIIEDKAFDRYNADPRSITVAEWETAKNIITQGRAHCYKSKAVEILQRITRQDNEAKSKL